MTSRNQREDMFVVSAREDCIDDTLDNACWLLNPKWKVRPSVAFIEGQGPCVLTCKAHDGGTKLHMIHACHWKNNLSSKRPDQLC